MNYCILHKDGQWLAVPIHEGPHGFGVENLVKPYCEQGFRLCDCQFEENNLLDPIPNGVLEAENPSEAIKQAKGIAKEAIAAKEEEISSLGGVDKRRISDCPTAREVLGMSDDVSCDDDPSEYKKIVTHKANCLIRGLYRYGEGSDYLHKLIKEAVKILNEGKDDKIPNK